MKPSKPLLSNPHFVMAATAILSISALTSVAQDSPYAIFGDRTPTLSERSHISTQEDTALVCTVFLTDHSVRIFSFNFKRGNVIVSDATGNTIQKMTLSPADIARFTTPDPKAAQYPSVSPYAYCAGSPICFTDPTGMYIEQSSQQKWEQMRCDITRERDNIIAQIEKIQAKAAQKGWSASKLAKKLGDRLWRIESLNGSLTAMGVLEQSTQGYALKPINGDYGFVKYDRNSYLININYISVANFVHEMTHAWQFEVGAIAFGNKSGLPRFQDVYDEVAAYQAQFAYSPNSVNMLNPDKFISSASEITVPWLIGIPLGGKYIYSPDGENNTGQYSVGIHSTPAQINMAYPKHPVPSYYDPLYDSYILIKR